MDHYFVDEEDPLPALGTLYGVGAGKSPTASDDPARKELTSRPIRAASVESGETRPNHEDILIAHVYVYAIADYHDIPELRSLARKRFVLAKEATLTLDPHRFAHNWSGWCTRTSQRTRPSSKNSKPWL